MKIKLSKSQWEGIGKKAGWLSNMPDRIEYNDKAIKMLMNFFPRLRDLLEKKIKKGENETLALHEIFDYHVKVDDDLRQDYLDLLKNLNTEWNLKSLVAEKKK
jgi:GTP-dependent phosphoenolpyruvate carboxykinase